MKKFLLIVSVLTALLLLLATPTAATYVEDNTYVIPEGIKVHYAENVSGKAPSIDGTIEEGEYGKAYRVETPVPVAKWSTKIQEESPADPTAVSEYVDFYFAYDEENVYIAIYEMGPKEIEGNQNLVPMRSNYSFNFGFMLDDINSYFNMEGYGTSSRWAKDEFYYFDQGNRVYNPPIYAYDLISECIAKKTDVKNNIDIAFGDLLSANGNANYTDAQCAFTVEFKFDKQVVAEALNQCYVTNYDTISDAMYFSFTTNTFPRNEDTANQWYRWVGQTDIRNADGKYIEYGMLDGIDLDLMLDLIVFADEGDPIKLADPLGRLKETEVPTTEEPLTELPAEKPEAEATTDNATEAPETEAPEKSGCASSASLAGLALVAALGTCTTFVVKKKED